MAFDPSRIPDSLKAEYRANRCAVLVGAGASAGAKLPTWSEFLELMIREGVKQNVVSGKKAAEYRKLINNPVRYLMVASGLKEDLGNYFDEFIEKTFLVPKPAPTALHHALIGLDRLQFVITTNYDTILEREYRKKDPDVTVCTHKDGGEIQRRLSKREFFILKAHGDAAKVGNGIILTDADYRSVLYSNRAYQSLLSAMFTMFTVVFIGASMSDPDIMLLMNYIADSFTPSSGPRHYALQAQEHITGVERDRWLKDMKVNLIPISRSKGYAEAIDFLKALGA